MLNKNLLRTWYGDDPLLTLSDSKNSCRIGLSVNLETFALLCFGLRSSFDKMTM